MSPTFRSLANPNYRRYAMGGVVSNVGTWMQRIAQDWLVLQLTGYSGAAIGITTGLQFLPFLLLSPVAGLVADRIPKRRLLQLTNVGMALPALVLGLLAVTGTAEIWHVYVLALALGTAAEGRDEHTGDGRADDARGVEARRVEADRVGEVVRADDLGHERLPRGCVEGRGRAEREGQDVDVPDLGGAGHREEAEHQRRNRHADVGQL